MTALVVALAGTGGPVVAAAFDAKNADRVDGRHAVGAGATTSQRAGKLVATGSNGRLPNNIIGKATDADRVDGLDSRELQFPSSVPAGQTIRGRWGFDVHAPGGGDWAATVSFPVPLDYAPLARYIDAGAPSTVACPGDVDAPEAAPGYLCYYRQYGTGGLLGSPTVSGSRFGGAILFSDDANAGDFFATGTWAVTAPPVK